MLVGILTIAIVSLAIAGHKNMNRCMWPFGLGAEVPPKCLQQRFESE